MARLFAQDAASPCWLVPRSRECSSAATGTATDEKSSLSDEPPRSTDVLTDTSSSTTKTVGTVGSDAGEVSRWRNGRSLSRRVPSAVLAQDRRLPCVRHLRVQIPLILIAMLLALPAQSTAQLNAGLAGTVTDDTGAVIASASISVRQPLTNRPPRLDSVIQSAPSAAPTQVLSASPVPIFAETSESMGRMVVGGYNWRFETDARRMTEVARFIASGTSPGDSPPARDIYATMLDWRQFQRWQVLAQSFFELNRRYVVGGLIVFAVQLALIVGLLVQRERRRRAEEQTRNSEARNSALLRAIPDLMFVLSRDGTFLDYNARDPELLFAPPSSFLGKKVRDVMPPSVAGVLMDALERACQSQDPMIVDYGLPMGETRFFEARLVSNGTDRVLSMVRDVTESKRILARNRDLAGRLIESQEAERTRIARDLHDGLGQEVAMTGLALSALRQQPDLKNSPVAQAALGRLQERTSQVAKEIRALSHDLHPGALRHLGLAPAVKSHCIEIEQRYDVQVSFTAAGDLVHVSDAAALGLFRISQEALRNAAVHGSPRRIGVSIIGSSGCLELTVTDDGKGFDVERMRGDNRGIGLVSMEERANLAGGVMQIVSKPGMGTTICVRVPAGANVQTDHDPVDIERISIEAEAIGDPT